MWNQSTSSHFIVEMNINLNSMGGIIEFQSLSFFWQGEDILYGNGNNFTAYY